MTVLPFEKPKKKTPELWVTTCGLCAGLYGFRSTKPDGEVLEDRPFLCGECLEMVSGFFERLRDNFHKPFYWSVLPEAIQGNAEEAMDEVFDFIHAKFQVQKKRVAKGPFHCGKCGHEHPTLDHAMTPRSTPGPFGGG